MASLPSIKENQVFKQSAEFASPEKWWDDESEFDATGNVFAFQVADEMKDADGYPKRTIHFVDSRNGTLIHSHPIKALTRIQWNAAAELLIEPSQEKTHPAYEVTSISPKLKTATSVLKLKWSDLERKEHALSPCGRWFVVAKGARIEVFELGSGRRRGVIEPDRKFLLYTLSTGRIAFSRDGDRLLVGEAFPDEDKNAGRGLLVYDVATLKLVQRVSVRDVFFGYIGRIKDVGGDEVLLGPCHDAEDFIEGDRAWVLMNLKSGMTAHFEVSTEIKEYCDGWYVRSPWFSKTPTTRVVDPSGKALLTVPNTNCQKAQFALTTKRLLLATYTKEKLSNLECRLLQLPTGEVLWSRSQKQTGPDDEPIFIWTVRMSNDGKRLAELHRNPKGVGVRFWEDR